MSSIPGAASKSDVGPRKSGRVKVEANKNKNIKEVAKQLENADDKFKTVPQLMYEREQQQNKENVDSNKNPTNKKRKRIVIEEDKDDDEQNHIEKGMPLAVAAKQVLEERLSFIDVRPTNYDVMNDHVPTRRQDCDESLDPTTTGVMIHDDNEVETNKRQGKKLSRTKFSPAKSGSSNNNAMLTELDSVVNDIGTDAGSLSKVIIKVKHLCSIANTISHIAKWGDKTIRDIIDVLEDDHIMETCKSFNDYNQVKSLVEALLKFIISLYSHLETMIRVGLTDVSFTSTKAVLLKSLICDTSLALHDSNTYEEMLDSLGEKSANLQWTHFGTFLVSEERCRRKLDSSSPLIVFSMGQHYFDYSSKHFVNNIKQMHRKKGGLPGTVSEKIANLVNNTAMTIVEQSVDLWKALYRRMQTFFSIDNFRFSKLKTYLKVRFIRGNSSNIIEGYIVPRSSEEDDDDDDHEGSATYLCLPKWENIEFAWSNSLVFLRAHENQESSRNQEKCDKTRKARIDAAVSITEGGSSSHIVRNKDMNDNVIDEDKLQMIYAEEDMLINIDRHDAFSKWLADDGDEALFGAESVPFCDNQWTSLPSQSVTLVPVNTLSAVHDENLKNGPAIQMNSVSSSSVLTVESDHCEGSQEFWHGSNNDLVQHEPTNEHSVDLLTEILQDIDKAYTKAEDLMCGSKVLTAFLADIASVKGAYFDVELWFKTMNKMVEASKNFKVPKKWNPKKTSKSIITRFAVKIWTLIVDAWLDHAFAITEDDKLHPDKSNRDPAKFMFLYDLLITGAFHSNSSFEEFLSMPTTPFLRKESSTENTVTWKVFLQLSFCLRNMESMFRNAFDDTAITWTESKAYLRDKYTGDNLFVDKEICEQLYSVARLLVGSYAVRYFEKYCFSLSHFPEQKKKSLKNSKQSKQKESSDKDDNNIEVIFQQITKEINDKKKLGLPLYKSDVKVFITSVKERYKVQHAMLKDQIAKKTEPTDGEGSNLSYELDHLQKEQHSETENNNTSKTVESNSTISTMSSRGEEEIGAAFIADGSNDPLMKTAVPSSTTTYFSVVDNEDASLIRSSLPPPDDESMVVVTVRKKKATEWKNQLNAIISMQSSDIPNEILLLLQELQSIL